MHGVVAATELSASGASLLYATFLGGSSGENGYGIAVDLSGNAYVAGGTSSTGWATAGAYDATYNGGGDIFVLKFSGLATLPVLQPTSPGLATSPGQTVSLLAPNFFWNPAGAASEYGLYISKLQPNGAYALVFDSTTYAGGVTIPGNAGIYTLPAGILQDGGQYRWNMNAKVNGVWGPYTSRLYFNVHSTSIPATDLGTLAIGTTLTRNDAIGNGAYGVKDVDLWTFTLTQTQRVTFDVDAQSTGSLLDGYLRLFK